MIPIYLINLRLLIKYGKFNFERNLYGLKQKLLFDTLNEIDEKYPIVYTYYKILHIIMDTSQLL